MPKPPHVPIEPATIHPQPAQRTLLDPSVYRSVFEASPQGAQVLAELERIFVRSPVLEGGIDAVLKTYDRAGKRSVIEWIVKRINTANGVPADENED